MVQGGFQHRLRVRYAETDQMGVVYHARYLDWFEVGRTEMIRQLGIDYRTLEEQGLLLPVVEVQARYKKPARYDDELTIVTRLADYRGATMEFQYEIWREGECLVTGASKHVWVTRDWRPTRVEKVNPQLHDLLMKVLQGQSGP